MLFVHLFAGFWNSGNLLTLENVLLQLPVATRAVGVDMAILVSRNDDLVQ